MKKYITSLLLAVVLCIAATFTAFAAEYPRLVDAADLLSQSEEETILSKLDEVSWELDLDLVIVTVDSTDGKSVMAFADDFFDYNGYGMGDGNDGILLLISMEERDWWISTSGYGIYALTDEGIQYIGEQFVSYLSDGDYAGGFSKFVDLCKLFVEHAREDKPYDIGNMPKEPFEAGMCLVISLVVGFVIALIVVSCMKGKLKSVRRQAAASAYIKDNGVNITDSRDTFLYKTVSKRAKPQESSSSGGGSSTHTSSSGSTHGGGGGKF